MPPSVAWRPNLAFSSRSLGHPLKPKLLTEQVNKKLILVLLKIYLFNLDDRLQIHQWCFFSELRLALWANLGDFLSMKSCFKVELHSAGEKNILRGICLNLLKLGIRKKIIIIVNDFFTNFCLKWNGTECSTWSRDSSYLNA